MRTEKRDSMTFTATNRYFLQMLITVPIKLIKWIMHGNMHNMDHMDIGGGQGGKHLLSPVPPVLPPVPFFELSLASRLFSTNLAMLFF